MVSGFEGKTVATGESGRVPGKWFVVPFVLVIAVTVAAFLMVKLSGRGAKARNYLALSYTAGLRDLDEGYYADAVKSLTPVVDAGIDPAAVGFRGEAFLRMKKFAEAEADFHRAIEREPNLPANHAGLAAALAGQGRHADALPHFDAALKLAEKSSPIDQVRRTGDTMEEIAKLREISATAAKPREN